MRELLIRQQNGIEVAFDRCKLWSKYATHLLNFGKQRLAMEQKHAQDVARLSEQTKSLLMADANSGSLPLVRVFEQFMDGATEFSNRTEQTVASLNQRFITVGSLGY
jgi:hypothetical protein